MNVSQSRSKRSCRSTRSCRCGHWRRGHTIRAGVAMSTYSRSFSRPALAAASSTATHARSCTPSALRVHAVHAVHDVHAAHGPPPQTRSTAWTNDEGMGGRTVVPVVQVRWRERAWAPGPREPVRQPWVEQRVVPPRPAPRWVQGLPAIRRASPSAASCQRHAPAQRSR